MKILIVDDEIFVRIGIKTIFDWNKYGFEIVGEAEDGIEAKELFIKYEPDIVLLDICMPRMNGLDFIKEIKEINPFCRFVILSCHNEFDYAREAIKLGVRDYIMKTTVKKDEILEIVCRIAEEIEIEKSKLMESRIEKKEIFTNRFVLLNRLLNDVVDKIEDDEVKIAAKIAEMQLNISTGNLHLILFAVDGYRYLKQEMEPKNYELLTAGITNIVQEISKQHENSYVFRRNEHEIITIVSFEKSADKKYIIEKLRLISRDTANAVKQLLNVDISAGASSGFDSFSQISEGYPMAQKALERKFFTGPSSVNLYYEKTGDSRELVQLFKKAEEELNCAFKNLDFDEALNLLKGIRKNMDHKSCDDYWQIKNISVNIFYNLSMIINNEKNLKTDIPGIRFDPSEVIHFECLGDILNDLEKAIKDILAIINNHSLYKNRNTINLVKEYINQNAASEITLNNVADHVNLSPGHLSRFFKKETGENFSDYIINSKMNTAKNMIRSGERIWKIAQVLGYAEVSSFSRIFRRTVGISPQQFRINVEKSRKISTSMNDAERTAYKAKNVI